MKRLILVLALALTGVGCTTYAPYHGAGHGRIYQSYDYGYPGTIVYPAYRYGYGYPIRYDDRYRRYEHRRYEHRPDDREHRYERREFHHRPIGHPSDRAHDADAWPRRHHEVTNRRDWHGARPQRTRERTFSRPPSSHGRNVRSAPTRPGSFRHDTR